MVIAMGTSKHIVASMFDFIGNLKESDSVIFVTGNSEDITHAEKLLKSKNIYKEVNKSQFDVFIDTNLKNCEDVFYNKHVPSYLLQCEDNMNCKSMVVNRCISWNAFIEEIEYIRKKVSL